jgi:soluble lytic murein transglycosylase-like protein
MMGTIGYLGGLVKSLFRSQGSRRPGAPFAPVLAAVVLSTAAFYVPALGAADEALIGDASVAEVRFRATRVKAMLAGVERLYERDVAPIERVLLTYRNDEQLARRIAVSLVREGQHAGLEPRLLLAVLLVENPWLDPGAVSPVGALGLMQVMPLHRGQWRACAPRLEEIESNICHGARIFAHYLKTERGNIDRALLRYNGCVKGTNTPNCHFYPQHVYARAGRASLLAWRKSDTTAP